MKTHSLSFLADRTNCRAIATVLRPSVVCLSVCMESLNGAPQQKLLLRAYAKSYMRNRLVPKINDLDLRLEVVSVMSTIAWQLTLKISETVRE